LNSLFSNQNWLYLHISQYKHIVIIMEIHFKTEKVSKKYYFT